MWKVVETKAKKTRIAEVKGRKKKIKKEKKKRKRPKNKRIMEVKKVAEEQEIWDKKVKVVKSEEEAKKLVSQKFYFLKRKQVREYQQKRYKIIQLM